MPGRSQRHLREFHRQDSGGRSRPYASVQPTMSGTATNGQTLTGVNGTFLPTGATVTRQWYRNGVPIPGATAATYVLAAADVGKKVAFGNIAYNSYGTRFAAAAPSATVA